ncbi:hypothetical protein ACFL1E_07240 [Candidatus Omnitrophota bacterium]
MKFFQTIRCFVAVSICVGIFSLLTVNTGVAQEEIAEQDNNSLLVYVKQAELFSKEQHSFLKRSIDQATFMIENRSDDFIVIRNFSIVDQLPDIQRWYGSQYGSAYYSPLEDVWIYNEVNQQLSEPLFAFGVIPPRKALEISRWFLVKGGSIQCAIDFQRLSKAEAGTYLYVNLYDKSAFSPKRIFQRAESEENIDALLKSFDNVDWRHVIAPAIREVLIQSLEVSCQIPIQELEVNLEKVKEEIGDWILDSIFLRSLNLWVVETVAANYMIVDDKAIELPGISLLAFILIESQAGGVETILPLTGYEQFNPEKPSIKGAGYFNPGITILPREKIFPLLQAVKDNGHKVTAFAYDSNGLGERYYLLVGEFDEKVRREVAQQSYLATEE